MSPRQILFAVAALLTSLTALAGSGSGPAHDIPTVDLSVLPASAVGNPPGQGDDPHPVVARLLSEQAVAVPGGTLAVGLHLTQQAHWHTYWKTPGDIGLPTNVVWTLPGGVEAPPHTYPIPVRYEQEGMVSFGYDDQVLHITEVTLPADLAPGTHTVKATADWLVCKTSCIPGMVELALPITVGDVEKASAFAPLFEHFRTRWPTPADAIDGLVVTSALNATPILPNSTFEAVFHLSAADGHTLELDGTDLWPTFTPITGADWMIDPTVEMFPADDGVFVTIPAMTFEPDPLPTTDVVGGLVQVKVDGEWVRTELTMPLPWATAGTATTASTAPVWQALDAAKQGAGTADAVADAEADAEPDDGMGDAAAPVDAPPAPPVTTTLAPATTPMVVLANLFFAFVGGLILNIMPCVLPVLMLKLYSLVEQGGISAAEKRGAGLAYTGGILVSFWVLAFAVWVARVALGNEVGWGFQMQYPGYVAGLATVVFLFALSMFGVFEIPAFGAGSASELGAKEGLGGYFFTGVFATLVATPCSAPILGTAIAFAFQAPIWMLVLAFTFIGLGLASPFLVIAFVPAAYRLLPQPGAWMETFKQVIGFTLVATAIWLVDVLIGLIGPDRAVGFLAFLATASLGAWIYGHFGGVAAEGRRMLLSAVAGGLVMLGGGYTFLDLEYGEDEVCDDGSVATDLSFEEHIPWQRFSEQRVDALAGSVMFVDFTADWCVSCKVNEATILETTTVRDAMAQHGVVPLVGDWTRRDEEITRWLQRYKRAGVPMYLVIPPTGPDDAILLPEVITPDMVVKAIERAAAEQVGRL